MIAKVLQNIKQAIRQTVANQGSAGVDKMPVSALGAYFRIEGSQLFTQIINHRYLPQAIRGVEIPKPDGKTRLLGVPTVVDRVLQQAVSQILAPKFELLRVPTTEKCPPSYSTITEEHQRRLQIYCRNRPEKLL